MKITLRQLAALALIALVMAGCESGPRVRMAPGYEPTATPIRPPANVMGTPEPTAVPATPTVPPLQTDNQLYTLPSLIASFYPPLGWQLTKEDTAYARFISPDGAAWMEAAVESSGYALSPEGFDAYVSHMLAALYSGAADYELVSREQADGKELAISSFTRSGFKWYALDVFYQRGAGLYALSFQAYEPMWPVYQKTFMTITDSLTTQSGYLKTEQIYKFRAMYKDPGGALELAYPMGWGLAVDEASRAGVRAVTFEAPDGDAGAELTVFKNGHLPEGQDIGQQATAELKARFGKDLKTVGYEVLPDGRIRFDWQAPKLKQSGYSIFWNAGGDLYILTVRQSGAHPETYQPVLDALAGSAVVKR
jgi:hypothetical protein